jgi:hypothetical protein
VLVVFAVLAVHVLPGLPAFFAVFGGIAWGISALQSKGRW